MHMCKKWDNSHDAKDKSHELSFKSYPRQGIDMTGGVGVSVANLNTTKLQGVDLAGRAGADAAVATNLPANLNAIKPVISLARD